MRLTSLMDAPTALTLEVMEACIQKDESQFTGTCNALQVRSHFQPIYSLARPSKPGGEMISPLTLFANQKPLAETVFADRLCRTLHVKNVAQQNDNSSWLFLNIHPAVMNQGKQFGNFFAQLQQNDSAVKKNHE